MKIVYLRNDSPHGRDLNDNFISVLSPHFPSKFVHIGLTYTDLEYSIIDGETSITLPDGTDLQDVAYVFMRHWHLNQELATVCGLYLTKHAVPFNDAETATFKSLTKLSELFQLAQNDIPVPDSFYPCKPAFASKIYETLLFPFVMKDIGASQGKLNFLIHDSESFTQILADHPDAKFIAQKFIPNTCDYRVLIFKGEILCTIKRTRRGLETHLNNTSQGADAELLDRDYWDDGIREMLIKTADVTLRDLAGIDIFFHAESNKPFILEVNYAPQLATGTFVETKMAMLGKAIYKQIS